MPPTSHDVIGFNCSLVTDLTGVCGLCGKLLKGRQTRWCSTKCYRTFVSNHRWTQARAAANKLAMWFQCAKCKGFFRVVEINHIVPCKGKHGQWGCWHHADNLEALCKPCHLIETNEQRANGWT